MEHYYRSRGVQHILWTDCRRALRKALKELQEVMLDSLQNERRFNRAVKTEYQVMVVGIPNVGKSSLINALRRTNLGATRAHDAVQEGRFQAPAPVLFCCKSTWLDLYLMLQALVPV